MRETWNFYSAGQLVFGPGSVGQLGELCRRHRWRRAFVVTDPTLIEVGILERVSTALKSGDVEIEVFAEGEAEPSTDIALSAAQQVAESSADVIIGVGGGSNMDLAKITAVVAQYGGQPQDYFGFDRVPGPVTPLICVPTTAGTGSEVSHAAVLTDRAAQMKVSSLSNWLRPTIAVVDAELTYSCPPRITADSGIDALTHAIEAYTATDFDKMQIPAGETCAYEGRYPLSDCIAEKAIQLIGEHLVRAVAEPADQEARQAMALAATLAGLAFSNAGVALVHALEYPLGGALHCSHGAGNGLLLPYVMQFNRPEREHTFARIARLLGEPTKGLSSAAAADLAVDAVVRLRQKIGIPHRIRELGGTREQLADFAAKSFAIERLRQVNPRDASQQDLLSILEEAW